eukprot:11067547-Ditylum_brightwellii.AAC.1
MNIAIKAKCDQLDSAVYWEKDLLHVIAKKYKDAECEKIHLWAITNISKRTKMYRRIVCLKDEDAIAKTYQFTYVDLLTETAIKYDFLVGSDEWVSFVPKKQNNFEPDLPTAYKAVIERAVSSSIAQFSSIKEGGGKSNTSGKEPKPEKRCTKCDSKDYETPECSCSDKS